MRFCPYGPLFSLPGFSVFAALICTWVSSWDCSFFRIESTHDPSEHLQIGLWMLEDFEDFETVRWGDIIYSTVDSNKCVLWRGSPGAGLESLDGPLWAARIFSLFACIFSLPLTVAFMMLSCKLCSQDYLKKIAICAVAEGVLLLLSMFALMSKWCTEAGFCHLKFAGIVCLVGGGLWIVGGCTVIFLKEDTYVEDAPVKSNPDVEFDEMEPGNQDTRSNGDSSSREHAAENSSENEDDMGRRID